MRPRNPVLAVAALTVLVGGCGGGSNGSSSDLTVFAPSSLREAFPKIDARPTYNFAGSDQLAAQIRQGAPADVFASASAKYPTELNAEGVVEQPVTFASNRLVLVVPTANPAGIRSFKDVAKKGVKLVVAGKGVPVGDYTRTVLDNLELSGALDNVVSNEQDVRGVLGKVTLGEADAGFVYVTDATQAAGKVTVLDIPADAQPPVAYQIAVVAKSRNKDAARAFIARVTSEAGKATLAEAGFITVTE